MQANSIIWLSSPLGILSLFFFCLAFLPNTIKFLKIFINKINWIKKATSLGLTITIFLALIHGLLMTQKEEIDFYNLKTYWIYAEGIVTFNLLIFFAFSLRELNLDSKKLSYLTYAILFLLGCHVWDKLICYF